MPHRFEELPERQRRGREDVVLRVAGLLRQGLLEARKSTAPFSRSRVLQLRDDSLCERLVEFMWFRGPLREQGAVRGSLSENVDRFLGPLFKQAAFAN